MIKCNKCGAKLPNNAKFCTECGSAVEIKRIKIKIAIFIFFIIVILIATALFFVNRRIAPERSKQHMYFKEIDAAMDINNPIVRDFVSDIVGRFPGDTGINKICSIFDYLSKKWKIVDYSKGIDYISPASNSISNGLTGDYDDFAILIASVLNLLDGKTRIILASNDSISHVFTEVFVGNDNKYVIKVVREHYKCFIDKIFGFPSIDKVYYRTDSKGRIWLNLDIKNRYAGGLYFNSIKEHVFYPSKKKNITTGERD